MARSVAIVTVFLSTEFPQCPHANSEGVTKQLQSCRCFRIKYCSPACQKVHWPAHKQICDRALPQFTLDEGAQNHFTESVNHLTCYISRVQRAFTRRDPVRRKTSLQLPPPRRPRYPLRDRRLRCEARRPFGKEAIRRHDRLPAPARTST